MLEKLLATTNYEFQQYISGKKAIIGLVCALNLSSFTGVALGKLAGHSYETQAVYSRLSTDWINWPGHIIGHKVFYDNPNYIETAHKYLPNDWGYAVIHNILSPSDKH